MNQSVLAQLAPEGAKPEVAVVLVNLGTPDAPTAPAVRRYLREFLSDRRVVEIPRALWWLILNGIILPFRSAKSAAKYATIWTKEGSPLHVWTALQSKLLRGAIGARGLRVRVEYAMRYGQPALPAVLDRLKAEGVGRVLILPLYPQYSATTTASIVDAVGTWTARQRDQPELRFVKRYADHPGYIAALAARITAHWERHGRELWSGVNDARLVLSFHGIPQRNVRLGDPYQAECLATARALTEALKLPTEQVVVCFQSRFGRAEWLQPYTVQTLKALARSGVTKVDVFCPGFTSDCLETLEEINDEAREEFLAAGGKEFRYIPCLNDQAEWISALGDIAVQNTAGWPVTVAHP